MPDTSVEIDMEDKAPIQEEKKPETKLEPQYAPIDKLEEIRKEYQSRQEKLEKQFNGISYGLRKIDELAKAVEIMRQVPQPVQPQVPVSEWDEKVTKDWKGTVEQLADIRAEQKYKEFREREKQEDMRQRMVQHQTSILEDSKRKVFERYPDIEDPASESHQKFMKVLSQNPSYLQNEYGPVLAMRQMEEDMRNEGKLDPQAKQVVDKEVQRQTRVSATSASTKGKAVSDGASGSLTSEEIKICKENGINQDTYLRMRKSINSERQAEV